MKQIYNKYKAIWWAWVNVKEPMTKDYFLRLQDIAYLDRKHKKGNWCLYWNSTNSIQSWVCAHFNDVFYFQDATEMNGIQMPFTIGDAPLNSLKDSNANLKVETMEEEGIKVRSLNPSIWG